jgi:aspartyl/asparaginyl beta-hydroxylase (cupin superfamily)
MLETYYDGRGGYLDPAEFEFARALEENYPAIREEALRLMSERVWVPYFAKETYVGQWDLFWLMAGGVFQKKNSRLCPKTSEVLARFPEIKYALFSAINPGTKLVPHTGAIGITRTHLVLQSDPEKAAWRVAGEVRKAVEGKTVMFEDGLLHEAWNDDDRPRITLQVTMASPNLSPAEIAEVYRRHDLQFGFLYFVKTLAKGSKFTLRCYDLALPVLEVIEKPVTRFVATIKPALVFLAGLFFKRKALNVKR